MSGAETIAVLGIISSVIAIVDGTKQLYDAASSAAGLPEAFREVAGRLPIVRGILQCAEQHIRDSPPSNQSCLAMKPLIDACEEKAKCLELIFQKVIPGDDASRLERYFRAARTLGKGGRVETLMEGLLKDVLLLASEHGMRAATSRQVGELENAIKDLSTLEPSIPDAVFDEAAFTNNNFGNGPMTNYNVAGDQKSQVNYGPGKQFQAETQTFHMGHEYVYQQSYRAQSQQFISTRPLPTPEELQRQCEDGILGELRFEGIDERYEDVDNAHLHTFQWIYERPELGFVQWLKSGTGVFWITGKPGSGKSTLMKFISEDQRTVNNLPKDIENRFITSFFFHEKGSNTFLKSQAGLFRAILYNILAEYPQLIAIALPERYKRLKQIVLSGQIDSSKPEFTIKKLRNGFKAIVNQSQMRLHLCLLIDGLDEFSGPYTDIVKTLVEFTPTIANSHVRVQMCLSSRPLREFEKAYLQHMNLKVQDLTADDIKLYVTTKFNEDAQLSDLLTKDSSTTYLIIDEILHKSEGVFLWVTLVVNSLIESLDNGDDMKILQRRLSVLPAGLIPLYKSMMRQIQPFYYEEAGRVFQMVHCAVLPLSPLAMSFAGDSPQESLTHELIFSDAEISKRHSDVAKQLKARTAGLVEMSPVRDPYHDVAVAGAIPSEDENQSLPWKQFQIQYMHLTVKEFLDSEDTPRWLAEKISASDDVHLTIAACCLRQLRATESPARYNYRERMDNEFKGGWCPTMISGIVHMIVHHTLHAERATRTSKLPYLKSLDDFITALPRKCNCVSQGEQCHWTKHRYEDRTEPPGWLNDFTSYLITLGMTQSVIDALNHGYNPATKSGRPLLMYAFYREAGVPAFERDIIDLVMVKELLERGCDPNQSFLECVGFSMCDPIKTTVWEYVLLHFWLQPASLSLDDDYHLQWLQVIKLFLEYGAKPNQLVVTSESGGKRSSLRYARRVSALTAFNEGFADFDADLVVSIRNSLVSKGAVEYDQSWTQDKRNRIPSSFDFDAPAAEPERNARSTLSIRSERAAQETGKNRQSGKRRWGCCAQS